MATIDLCLSIWPLALKNPFFPSKIVIIQTLWFGESQFRFFNAKGPMERQESIVVTVI